MNFDPIYLADDDYGKLCGLLDERRKMMNRHSLAKKKPSRKQWTLAEKLEIDRKHKAELTELNGRIENLKQTIEGY